METQINSLVYDYLSAVSPKVAKKFKEVVKPEELPAGNKVIILDSHSDILLSIPIPTIFISQAKFYFKNKIFYLH